MIRYGVELSSLIANGEICRDFEILATFSMFYGVFSLVVREI